MRSPRCLEIEPSGDPWLGRAERLVGRKHLGQEREGAHAGEELVVPARPVEHREEDARRHLLERENRGEESALRELSGAQCNLDAGGVAPYMDEATLAHGEGCERRI